MGLSGLARLRAWLAARLSRQRPIDDALWNSTLGQHPFLAALNPAEQASLRSLCAGFLARKEFSGAHGFEITDAVALAVAAQACLPILRLPGRLRWYDDFVGIVVHPDEMLADREILDEAGVVHRYRERIAGEAMDKGPVTLNWKDIERALPEDGVFNLVIHEFAHKIDMRDGQADGCPPLPAGFLGSTSNEAARDRWFATFTPTYEEFRRRAIMAERFSGEPTWLDPYAAQSPGEFFAVGCEAYFVSPERFRSEHPLLARLFDAFFKPFAA